MILSEICQLLGKTEKPQNFHTLLPYYSPEIYPKMQTKFMNKEFNQTNIHNVGNKPDLLC